MAKKGTGADPQFECVECGYQSPKYFGRCPQCQSWNSMAQSETTEPEAAARPSRPIQRISEIAASETERIATGMEEFDRLLGGGIVRSSVILIGGEPGVGKSTLLLQISQCLARRGFPVLYCSGEESASQIKLRADRLGIDSERIFLTGGSTLPELHRHLEEVKPAFLIIDSIQTLHAQKGSAAAGSSGAMRNLTAEIVELAKTTGVTVFIIGHITKEGQLAGPKTLEHLVDAVLYFEGELQTDLRVLRAEKNRFGSVDELGIFRMTEQGLASVPDPSGLFVQHRKSPEPGISIFPAQNGQRTILIEIQALAADSPFVGNPRRIAIGFDSYKMAMLIAIIEKRLRLPFYKSDVFLNVTGGLAIRDTAADLAVCASVVTSFKSVSCPPDAVFIGEVGLTGEIRPVPALESRLREASRQGFAAAFVPAGQSAQKSDPGLKLIPLENISGLAAHLRQKPDSGS